MYYCSSLVKVCIFLPCAETISTEVFSQIFPYTIMARHGMPGRIISDHDPRFTSRFWSALVCAVGCEHGKFCSHHPETNGQSEQIHRSPEQIF